ncbi:MAG: FUSC family protein [Xanthomonadaceae bacterium]|nr:FUSC family protein [Xanthomonadaceae bacterium]
MPSTGYSLRHHAIESLTAIKRPDVPLQVVLRNAAAVILPLGIGIASGHVQVGLGVAAGALNTMFSDQPGPYRQRMHQLLLASLVAGLASLVGLLVGGELPLMLLATAACGFFGGLLVVFGVDTARVGMTSMILLVVTASTPTSPAAALGGAALIFAGGLLLTTFSLAGWPLQRYWPERQAVAKVYEGLSAMALPQARDEAAVPALTEAMTSLQYTLLGRHRAHGRAMEAFGVLLELAERIRLELMAMDELADDTATYRGFRHEASRVLAAIAEALHHGDAPEQANDDLRTLRASEQALFDGDGNPHGLAAHVHALAGQLAAAARNADWAGSRGELRAMAAETRLPESLRSNSAWATLRAAMTPHSVAFRHAVRMAVCLSAALWLSRLLQLPHGYWLPMTAAIVLRPDFAATFKFGLLRVLGTVFGLVITTVLLHITPYDPWAHLLLMALLCMAFRYLATAHYGIAVAALTGTVVILLSFDGVNPGEAVIARVINTAFGCGMALLAYVAWPTWERGRARAALAAMLEAYASYLRSLARPDQRRGRHEARSAARTARINAQASIERMRAEPGTPAELLATAHALFANGNRLARSAMTLEALLDDLSTLPGQAEIRLFIDTLAGRVQTVAETLRGKSAHRDLPDLRRLQRHLLLQLDQPDRRPAAELLERVSDRLVDNVNTLVHVMERPPALAAPAG